MDFKTSKPVQSIGAPPPATVSKIDARLNKQQIAYFNEHARGELSFRIQERLEGERNNGINQ